VKPELQTTMLPHLLALTLGALSFVNAAPSHQAALVSCSANAHTGASAQAMTASGTYEIHSKALDGAAVRVYLPGQPLYASRSTEDALDYKLFDLTWHAKNMISLRHIGLDSPVTVDNDNWVSTAQSKDDFEIFVLESVSGLPGYFVIHSAVSADLVWTLNSADGSVSQNIKVAERVSGSQAQLFTFTPGKSSAQVNLEQLFSSGIHHNYMKTDGRVRPGAYTILDTISRAPLRTGKFNQPIYSSRSQGGQYPGNAGLWEIAYVDDPQGDVYTIRNIGMDVYMGVTRSKNIAPTDGAPGKFTFEPRFEGRLDQVVIHMADRSGVWGPDVSRGIMDTPIQVQPDRGMYDQFQTFILKPFNGGADF
ncbi:unnamed protein product, partial [Mycena citricolor]